MLTPRTLTLSSKLLRPSLGRPSATTLHAQLTIKTPTFLAPFLLQSARAFSNTHQTMGSEFRLKGLTSLDLRNGEKKEVEVEGVEDGKVLLVKIKNVVHALSPKCTHYGAPLKNGVVTASGRLTCPWHGACFSVTTGDVEDAPALDSLAKFDLVERDGGVYITKCDEATIKANRRALNFKCSAQGTEKVVIVGGGSGATGALEGLRQSGFTGHITCISNEGTQPYDRPKLSKALIPDLSKVAHRTPDFYKSAGISMVEDDVTSIDFSGKSVVTAGGKSYSYTKLILASGGNPRSLPLDGLREGQLKNVFLLRNLSHTQAISAALGPEGSDPKTIVVIGSSFIGLEVANALVSKKHDVTVIGMEEVPAQLAFGKRVGSIFKGILEKNGIKFIMQASVANATPASDDSSRVGAVHLKDGTTLPADLVIEGVGVAPATAYLRNDQTKGFIVELEKDGSLLVDEQFAVKGLSDVYAVGDIAKYPYNGPGGEGKPVRIEHWNVAQNAGRAVARTIAATADSSSTSSDSAARTHDPVNFIPIFWSALGSQLRYCGNTMNGYDEDLVLVQGETSPDKPSFVAYYTKGEQVVAVATMGKDPVMVQSAELLRMGKMPSRKELDDGVDVMGIALSG